MGGLFGLGEVSGFVAEVGEAGLQVERQGVVDFAADVVVGEVLAEVVAAGGADDVLVEDVSGAGVGVGEDDAVGGGSAGEVCGLEELVVAGGEGASFFVPTGEMAEFYLEDGGLEGVEAGVPADLVVEVAAAHAVGAEYAGVIVKCGGGSGDEAGVSEGGEIFGGVEGEGCGVAQGSGGHSVPGSSEGLSGVFDDN